MTRIPDIRGKRLVGLGTLYEWHDGPGPWTRHPRPTRVVDVTADIAAQWDHDILNRAPIARDIMAAVKARAQLPNGYSVQFRYRGRVFATWYPSSEES